LGGRKTRNLEAKNPNCARIFKKTSNKNRHVKTCKINSGRESIKCRFCDFGLHPNSSKQWLPCNQFNDGCDFVTKSFVEFRRHMLKAHNLKVNCKFQGRPGSTSLLKPKS